MNVLNRAFRHFGKKGLALWGGVAIVVGNIVGAGILGIPYGVAAVGFGLGTAMLVFLACLNLVVQFMYAEVVVRTSKDHQTPGYVRTYLGKRAGTASFVIDLLIGYGTILAYIVGIGEVLYAVLGGSAFRWSTIAFVLMGYIVYRGLESIKRFEMVLTVFIFFIVFLIGVYTVPHQSLANLTYWRPGNMAVPYGILLFALAGSPVIPQARRAIVGYEKSLPFVLILANAIIFVLYLAFMYLVLGVTGVETTEVGTIGLGEKIGPIMIVMGNVLAVFTISTSFLTNGMTIRRMFQYDYGKSRVYATLLALGVPLGLFLLGMRDFIQILGLVGGTLLSAQGIFIVLTYWKALKHGTRKPEFSFGKQLFVGAFLIVTFVVGAIVSLFH